MESVLRILFGFLLAIPAITFHEFSHAFAAYHLGDPTASIQGRMRLNPKAHIHVFGTIILPLTLLLLSGGQWVFGFAKPVPIEARNFKSVKYGLAISAAAGPVSNFLLAIVSGLLFRLVVWILPSGTITYYITMALYWSVYFNLVLGLFNLIPIPPMDGFKVLGAAIPDSHYYNYIGIERYGMVILIGFIFLSNMMQPSLISRLIFGPLTFLLSLITGI